MKRESKVRTLAIATLAIVASAAAAAARGITQPSRNGSGAMPPRVVFDRALPRMDGSHLTAKVLEITYAPGESTPSHRHPCAVIGYVIEGALRVKVNDGAEVVAKAGDTFFEAPNDLHAVSANASRTEPARFLAQFICDRDAPLLTPAEPGR